MKGSVITVFRNVRHRGRVIAPGEYEVGDETTGKALSEDDAEAVLTYPSWAALSANANANDGDGVEFDLSADDDVLLAMLEPMSPEMRDGLWTTVDAEAMANYLVERVGKERKNWQVQTMGNMIEKHLGLQ